MKSRIFILSLMFFFYWNFAAQAETLKWPREIQTEQNLITIYQPQYDSFIKNNLKGRVAVSVKNNTKDEVLFCVAWFGANIDTDVDKGTGQLREVKISKIHFPDLEDEKKLSQLTALLEKEMSMQTMPISLDHLTAQLADVDGMKKEAAKLENSPPDVYFRTSPTSLITIDGEPIIKTIDNSNLEYVVNTPFFIIKEKGGQLFYLLGNGHWYASKKITSGWVKNDNIPDAIKKFADSNKPTPPEDIETKSGDTVPDLLVVTKPSELVQTLGKPDYQPIQSTTLLYVKNTESEILLDVNSQQHFILLAGRWYRSKSMTDGDWKFTEPDKLPKEFLKIPKDSAIATVRSSVAGTEEAEEAVLQQSIPQTAVVERKGTTVKVTYDGKPEFKTVTGTEVAYAVNSDKTVLKIHKKYYCVDNAIWFISEAENGPWLVCDKRPDEVNKLPSDSEVYHVKYVYIFDSTPETVYVGYYPGYCHSYVYHGVVVYGTGYWYRPWYGHYYYPRPVTWGFGVHWSPYSGWGFHVSYSHGWVGWGFHPGYRGRAYWGPRGYNRGYRHGYNRGHYDGFRKGVAVGNRMPSRNVYNVKNNNLTINKQNNFIKRDTTSRLKASNKANNIYADKAGNVHQRKNDGTWQQKKNSITPKQQSGASALSTERPVANKKVAPAKNRETDRQLNRSHQNRSRGHSRANSRPQSRPRRR